MVWRPPRSCPWPVMERSAYRGGSSTGRCLEASCLGTTSSKSETSGTVRHRERPEGSLCSVTPPMVYASRVCGAFIQTDGGASCPSCEPRHFPFMNLPKIVYRPHSCGWDKSSGKHEFSVGYCFDGSQTRFSNGSGRGIGFSV